MDFRLGEEAERFREEVRAFLDEHLTAERLERERRSGDGHDPELHAAWAARGWLTTTWPRELGGQERSAWELQVLRDELRRRGYPYNSAATTEIVGQTLILAGNDYQRREILPRIAAGEVVICLGYTEPGSGSDVAAARTRAVRDGDEWIVHGQKMFTTGAHLCQYCFLLARTDPERPKHRGLTLFLLPLDQPGVELQAVPTLAGDRTNALYLSGARVPDRLRVGPVNGAMQVMSQALRIEQGISFDVQLDGLHEAALRWARDARRGEGRALDEPRVRERLARVALDAEVARLLGRRTTWLRDSGRPQRAEGPMAKLFSTERLIRGASAILDLLGAPGLLQAGEPGAASDGAVEQLHRFAQGTSIYAGTSEVMRSLIAEKQLGLPRTRS